MTAPTDLTDRVLDLYADNRGAPNSTVMSDARDMAAELRRRRAADLSAEAHDAGRIAALETELAAAKEQDHNVRDLASRLNPADYEGVRPDIHAVVRNERDRLRADLARVTAERDAAQRLARRVDHPDGCPALVSLPCSCGLDAARKAAGL